MSLTKVTYSMIDGSASNVQDFGATGNGVTDDAASIQSALDSGAKSVFIPPGEYRVNTTLEIPSDVEVYGVGGSSIIALGADTNIIKIDGTSNVYLHDFAVDGKSATYTDANNNAVFIDWRVTAGENVKLENLHIHSTGGAGIIGLAAVGTPSTDVQILNCKVEDTGTHGIILQDYISDVLIRGNTVKSSGLNFADRPGITASRYGNNVIVSDNVCVGSASALGTSVHGISIDGTENATCAGNIVYDWKGYGIEVGGVTNGAFQGNSVSNCDRAAIAMSGSVSSTIKNINIAVTGNTLNSNNAQGIYAFMTGGNSSYLHENITVSGNVINGTVSNAGIDLNFIDRITVANNSVYDAFLSGVLIDNCKEINITGNTAVNNNCVAIKDVTSITLSGTTATVTSAGHGYSNGDVVTIWGATPADYNGTYTISNVATDTFDYTTTSGLASPAAGAIQCTTSNSVSHGGVSVRWSVITSKETCVFGINLIDKNAFRNVYDVTVNGLYGYINDWFVFQEASRVPPANILTSGVVANERDRMALFMKNDKWTMAYNNAGTVNYATLDLDGSDTAWANGATAP